MSRSRFRRLTASPSILVGAAAAIAKRLRERRQTYERSIRSVKTSFGRVASARRASVLAHEHVKRVKLHVPTPVDEQIVVFSEAPRESAAHRAISSPGDKCGHVDSV